MNLIESDVIANGIHIHVYRTESDKPPLIFAHGSTDNGLCFWPFAQKLADRYEIILYDSRYHGRSEAPQPPSNIIERAHDLAGLVDALGLEKPGVIGHSLGATTASLCAGLYPDKLGFVVLVDPPLFTRMAEPDEATRQARLMYRDFIASCREKSIEEVIETGRDWSPTWPEAERLPWAVAKQQVDLATFDETAVPVDEAHRIASQIKCPLLLITADTELGSLFPPERADQFVQSLPNGKHVNIPGAGHNIRREQPERFLEVVQAFLDDL